MLKLFVHVKTDVPSVCIVNMQLHCRCPHEAILVIEEKNILVWVFEFEYNYEDNRVKNMVWKKTHRITENSGTRECFF